MITLKLFNEKWSAFADSLIKSVREKEVKLALANILNRVREGLASVLTFHSLMVKRRKPLRRGNTRTEC